MLNTILFETSIKSLLRNKLRLFLTTLGVIIGVFAVVTLVSLGKGIQNYIQDQFNQLGSNLLFITPGKASFGRDPAETFTKNKLKPKHANTLKTYAGDFISQITPWVSLGEKIRYKNKTYYASINGINTEGVEIFSYTLEKGRGFTKNEVKNRRRVIIIGPKVSQELFFNTNPLGKKVVLGSKNFTVIGVFKEKGQNYDNGALIPYTTALEVFDIENISGITIRVKKDVDFIVAQRVIKKALQRDLKEDDFSVLAQSDILKTIQNILKILTLTLGAIAGISLLVGGIGIMNIMYVSVTERTREIGLRKAVGATPKDIALQFLIESVLISSLGGIVGLLLGWGASLIPRAYVRTEVPWWAVFLALGFSIFVGIVFGTAPALKAAKKDPIEALRYE